MDKQELISELRGIFEEYLAQQGLELVDLLCHHDGGGLLLRILIDRPDGGISLGECAQMNSEFGRLLDEKNLISGRYVLEVSSPGLDRPLRTKADFARCVGRRIHVFLSEPIAGKLELQGIIVQVDEAAVELDREGEIVAVPLEKINKARQIIGNS